MAKTSTHNTDFVSMATGNTDVLFSHQLPALAIVAPLLIAALIAVIYRRALSIWLTQLISYLVFAATLGIFFTVQQSGDIVYFMGGWQSPYGISLDVDLLNAFVGVLVGLLGAACSGFLPQLLKKEIPDAKVPLFCAAYLLCMAGLLGITYTGDAFNVFVFLEISSLASYTLIALGRDRRALTAAYQYLIMGTIGATFILIGIGFLYAMTGSLNIADISNRLETELDSETVKTAFAFLTVGIALKAAVFPLHLWLNNAYSFAPSVVSAFIAATSTKVSVYLFFRFFFTLFGYEHAFDNIQLNWILIPLSLLGIFFGTYRAFFVQNVKSLLASSSVAQVGYMTLGIGLASQSSLAGSVVHLFNHGLMKGLLFLSIAGMLIHLPNARLEHLQGAARRYPLLGIAVTIGGLSLIGVPFTAGFTGKLLLLQSAAEQGRLWLVFFILCASVGALFYVWRFLSVIWFGEANQSISTHQPNDPLPWTRSPLNRLALLGIVTLMAANLYFGIFTQHTLFVADAISQTLLLTGANP